MLRYLVATKCIERRASLTIAFQTECDFVDVYTLPSYTVEHIQQTLSYNCLGFDRADGPGGRKFFSDLSFMQC